eukprot:TRINITY_DN2616_c0_g9_i4.p1 TRINITY_DN2616_c0_g9~~TRINITY_DN2616_c0_g9_i4.p1  ORF type:complete len:270 (+),score=101.22 TRINITY_DN2616_c0_g9_i4:235-1044(+)
MSLEAKLKTKYKDQLDTVDDVEELILDELVSIPQISPSDKSYLERFSGLETLSMNYLGLVSLKNLPEISTVTELQLNENAIANGLEALAVYPKLLTLELANNKITEPQQLQPLEVLKSLKSLVLDGCPLTEEENYRDEIFKLLPHLKLIDGKDSQGNDIPADSSCSDNDSCKEAEVAENPFGQIDEEIIKEEARVCEQEFNTIGYDYFSSQLEVGGGEDGFGVFDFKGEEFECDNLKDLNCSTREDLLEFPVEDDCKDKLDGGKFGACG